MKFRPDTVSAEPPSQAESGLRDVVARSLTPELRTLLEHLRDAQAFNAERVIDAKVHAVLAYLERFNLSSTVVAVSGGIDSALVLALLARAHRKCPERLQRVVPVLLPVHDGAFATGQDTATLRGRELCQQFGLRPVCLDLTPIHQLVKSKVDAAVECKGEGWAGGQLVSYQRTPVLYYVTSLLSQQGQPGILVGTTNYDEGAYLGYFGKASDGLVDVQLISDLHKHQVYELSKRLRVPTSILEVTPTGDMYDGRVDEEVFGASYDAVELFLRAKRSPDQVLPQVAGLDAESQIRFSTIAGNLEALHRYNAHKYMGRSPSVHLDVLPGLAFEGSWDYFRWSA